MVAGHVVVAPEDTAFQVMVIHSSNLGFEGCRYQVVLSLIWIGHSHVDHLLMVHQYNAFTPAQQCLRSVLLYMGILFAIEDSCLCFQPRDFRTEV